jgi:hypothetical protein
VKTGKLLGHHTKGLGAALASASSALDLDQHDADAESKLCSERASCIYGISLVGDLLPTPPIRHE